MNKAARKLEESEKTYFINTSVTKEIFFKVKSKSHELEVNRSEYIRELIYKDLKVESK